MKVYAVTHETLEKALSQFVDTLLSDMIDCEHLDIGGYKDHRGIDVMECLECGKVEECTSTSKPASDA